MKNPERTVPARRSARIPIVGATLTLTASLLTGCVADPGLEEQGAGQGVPSLEIFKYPSPVLDNGPPGSYDEGYLGEPCVQLVDGLYEMWYEAIEYPPYDAGHRWTIAYASSRDGVHWIKDPARRFLPNPDYPWCNKEVLEPWGFKQGGLYRMYFSANGIEQIGYADSPDGTHWKNYRLVLGAAQLEGKKINGLPILTASEPSVVERSEGGYIMYFQAETSGNFDHIGYAVSPDGVDFTVPADEDGNHTPAWNARDAWQPARGLAGPCVVRHGGLYYLFCSTWSAPYNLGYAVSQDGLHFTPGAANPLAATTPFSWDNWASYEPGVLILPDGRVQMWWNGVRERGGRTNARYVGAIAYGFGYLDGSPSDSLVCHWPLDESGGSQVEDETVFGHRGRNEGAVVGRSGARPEMGTAYEFDGQDDFLWAHHMPLLGRTSFRISFYLWPGDVSRPQALVSKSNVEGMFSGFPSREWRIGIDGRGRPFFEVGRSDAADGFTRCRGSRPIVLQQWQHIQAEYSEAAAKISLYLDGQLVAGSAHPGGRRTGRSILSIGAELDFQKPVQNRAPLSRDMTHDMGRFFKGALDDLRFYASAR